MTCYTVLRQHLKLFNGCDITWYEEGCEFSQLISWRAPSKAVVTRAKVWVHCVKAVQLKERANPPAKVCSSGVLYTQRMIAGSLVESR